MNGYVHNTFGFALIQLILLTACLAPLVAVVEAHTMYQIIKNGHGKGRDLVVIDWKTHHGKEAGKVEVPVTGLGRIGPVSVKLRAVKTVPNAYEWDTREWQWWNGYTNDQDKMPVRYASVAAGGADRTGKGVRVWTRYVSDNVETTQEWFFDDLAVEDVGIYDCLITVCNLGEKTLQQYGQFFACYTAWNGSNGHFYVDADGSPVNYRDAGSRHLDYYVTAKGSPFERLGRVPHCPRGGGIVKATWKYPISISHPGPDGFRHLVLTEEARTAAIAQGMKGIAQDYMIYPPGGHLKPGGEFRVHVRHFVIKLSEATLVECLDQCWAEFVKNHKRVHSRSLVPQRRQAEE